MALSFIKEITQVLQTLKNKCTCRLFMPGLTLYFFHNTVSPLLDFTHRNL